MPIETAPWSLVLAPLCLTVALTVMLPALLPLQRRWARAAIVGVIWLCAARYLVWRVTQTLVLQSGWLPAAWSLLCFAVELLAFWDGALLFLAFLRTTDRTGEADRHEARMRTLAAETAPKVDVFIPTYNESLEVLEKTIVGALSLVWPNIAIYVLDDGRRPWLKAYCEEKGVGYVTRPDNKGAKAGNINHALKVTDGEFVAIFDADFVPQRSFLLRTMGFFEAPEVGIVQAPHAFYNHDPMQANLAMRQTLPDDQRFFFDSIMPSRDGWNAAFCCGSNSVTRRTALESVGNGLPDGSITEDMLLSLVMLRQGYVTRYVCERLAFGLAPETVAAFFVQRQRWARGAIQMLFLKAGPLGPGLSMIHRLLFMPTHWLTQALMCLFTLVTPLVFLLTGLAPMTHTSIESVLFYLAPALVATLSGFTVFGRGNYHPLAAQVLGMFQSFKLLPTVFVTLWRPHGHAFKVTPKGADAASQYERGVFAVAFGLLIATAAGLLLNVRPEWRVIDDMSLVPLVAAWSAFNILILLLVCLLCLQMPARRGEERFAIAEPILARHRRTQTQSLMMSRDMSLSGIGFALEPDQDWRIGDEVEILISECGWIDAEVTRIRDATVGLKFAWDEGRTRDLFIRKIFTSGLNTASERTPTWRITLGLLKRILTADMRIFAEAAAQAEDTAPVPPPPPPEKLPAASLLIQPAGGREALAEALEARRAA